MTTVLWFSFLSPKVSALPGVRVAEPPVVPRQTLLQFGWVNDVHGCLLCVLPLSSSIKQLRSQLRTLLGIYILLYIWLWVEATERPVGFHLHALWQYMSGGRAMILRGPPLLPTVQWPCRASCCLKLQHIKCINYTAGYTSGAHFS
jgi:hypothetical protein